LINWQMCHSMQKVFRMQITGHGRELHRTRISQDNPLSIVHFFNLDKTTLLKSY
jgi:hypothetical protein